MHSSRRFALAATFSAVIFISKVFAPTPVKDSVVVEEKKALRCIISTSILLVAFSIALFFFGAFGLVYMMTASVLGGMMLLSNLWLFIKPTKQNAWTVFRFSSPYPATIFLAMIIDVLVS